MLRSNSKILRQRVRSYILESINLEGYEHYIRPNDNEMDVLWRIFKTEKPYKNLYFTTFKDWLLGLTSALNVFETTNYDGAREVLEKLYGEDVASNKMWSWEQCFNQIAYLIYNEIQANLTNRS